MKVRDETHTGDAGVLPESTARPRKSRVLTAFKAFLLAAITIGVLYLLGFLVFANRVAGMETPAEPVAADSIIVLTGGQFRLNAAVDLLKAGKGKRLLISGVYPDTGILSLQAITGADKTLFECCIDIDHEALDTAGNAAESAKWLHRHGFSSAIIVTNNYHMPRSLLEMKRYVNGARLHPYPVVNAPLDGWRWIVQPDVLRVLFTEYVKYVAAIFRSLF